MEHYGTDARDRVEAGAVSAVDIAERQFAPLAPLAECEEMARRLTGDGDDAYIYLSPLTPAWHPPIYDEIAALLRRCQTADAAEMRERCAKVVEIGDGVAVTRADVAAAIRALPLSPTPREAKSGSGTVDGMETTASAGFQAKLYRAVAERSGDGWDWQARATIREAADLVDRLTADRDNEHRAVGLAVATITELRAEVTRLHGELAEAQTTIDRQKQYLGEVRQSLAARETAAREEMKESSAKIVEKIGDEYVMASAERYAAAIRSQP